MYLRSAHCRYRYLHMCRKAAACAKSYPVKGESPSRGTNNGNTPCRADKPGQDEAFIFTAELHDAGGLKLATDPVCLVEVVDEHEFHANVTTVHFLQEQHNGSTVTSYCKYLAQSPTLASYVFQKTVVHYTLPLIASISWDIS